MVELTDSFTLPLPCVDAWPLFTARGERDWVPGWDPSFPGEEDDRVTGTVFTTGHGDRLTTWIVTAAEPGHRIGYARVAEKHTAGTVVVTCRALSPCDTEVTVTYQLTALTPDAAAELSAFANTYTDYIGGWRQMILRARAMPPENGRLHTHHRP